MGHARRLDDVVVATLVAAQSATTSAGTSTPSGAWVDIENYDGDLLILVNVGVFTATSLNYQVQVSGANTGASPSNCVDPRGTTLAITAAGVYALALAVLSQPQPTAGQTAVYIGLTGTFTGTSALVSAVLVARKKSWDSGVAI
jgi:hypothetical protein